MFWHMQVPKSKTNPRHASDTSGNYAPVLFCQPSQRGQPRHCAVRPMSAPWRCATHSRTDQAPHPRKRMAEPSKGGRTSIPLSSRTTPWRRTSEACLLRHHRSCAAIPTITTPSRALQRHPQCCGSTGRQDAATLVVVRLTASRQLHPRVIIRTTTKLGISAPPPSKPPLDGHRACHDAPPEARFARTAVYSMILCVVPPHVVSTARHACKLPPLGL
jgi:hypothetical protein